MRVKVILNPWADRGRGIQQKELIEKLGQQHGGLDLVVTQRPRHAQELALQAADEGYDVIVAAGGDGTIHEVINGLFTSQSEAKLGVLPIGSGNDFAYSLGISTDMATAVPQLFHVTLKTIDLARIEDAKGHFQIVDNNIGIGFDAMVVVQTESITRIHGFLMYFIAVLRTIAFYYQTPHLEIRFDDEQVAQATLFLAIGVGPRGGGGFFLTPDAKQDDDRIDSCLVNPVGRLTMLGMLQQAIKGTHVNSRHVTMRQSQRISLKANMPLPIHVDGEMFAYPQDDVRHVTITSLPAALQVMT
jgi:YegS/Rv2252/BmrU family lipid kinase